MMVDRDLDPADNLVSDARDEGNLIFGAGWQRSDPSLDFGRGALVAELLGENRDFVRVVRLDRADHQFRCWRICGISHVNMFSRIQSMPRGVTGAFDGLC